MLEDRRRLRPDHDHRLRRGVAARARGVAFAYSAVMMFWIIPHILWCINGTGISFGDILLAARSPRATDINATILASGGTRP
jgi:hypothetical protein